MKPPVVFSEGFTFDWPGHIFPTGKYEALARELRAGGLATEFHVPSPATREELRLAHRDEYLERLEAISEGRAEWDPSFECPVTPQVVEAFVLSTGGTIQACRLALTERYAVNIGGGFHHAFPDHGEGFCLVNDVAVAAKVLLAEGRVGGVLVVDLDVHQGNGTAVAARDEPRIFTLSVHQQNNYPPKEVSDLDVGLPDLCDDGRYLDAVKDALRRAGESCEADLLLYLAGADPFERDRLGGLAVTAEGLAERDRIVLDFAEERGMAVCATLAGGYATEEREVVRIHYTLVEEILRRWRLTR